MFCSRSGEGHCATIKALSRASSLVHGEVRPQTASFQPPSRPRCPTSPALCLIADCSTRWAGRRCPDRGPIKWQIAGASIPLSSRPRIDPTLPPSLVLFPARHRPLASKSLRRLPMSSAATRRRAESITVFYLPTSTVPERCALQPPIAAEEPPRPDVKQYHDEREVYDGACSHAQFPLIRFRVFSSPFYPLRPLIRGTALLLSPASWITLGLEALIWQSRILRATPQWCRRSNVVMRPQSYVQSIRSAFPDHTRDVHESCPQRGQPPCRSHLPLTMQGSLAASVCTRAGHGSRGVLEATSIPRCPLRPHRSNNIHRTRDGVLTRIRTRPRDEHRLISVSLHSANMSLTTARARALQHVLVREAPRFVFRASADALGADGTPPGGGSRACSRMLCASAHGCAVVPQSSTRPLLGLARDQLPAELRRCGFATAWSCAGIGAHGLDGERRRSPRARASVSHPPALEARSQRRSILEKNEVFTGTRKRSGTQK
ncbi:hypothetical protein C8Q76DRAFT_424476 [Earliella scabrosa]|nr:hypothetical protein C8Q76DRAFT_424476 [Earliella scabrosa]